MVIAVNTRDGSSFIAADDRFHQILVEAGGFPHIAEIIGRVNAQLDRVRHLSSTDRTRARTAVREHRGLIKALRAKDGPGSSELLRRHLEGCWALIRKIVAEKISGKIGRTELV
ncbi:MAG: FCD domain-containing protein [Hyphomicrobiaceae bacterium]